MAYSGGFVERARAMARHDDAMETVDALGDVRISSVAEIRSCPCMQL